MYLMLKYVCISLFFIDNLQNERIQKNFNLKIDRNYVTWMYFIKTKRGEKNLANRKNVTAIIARVGTISSNTFVLH